MRRLFLHFIARLSVARKLILIYGLDLSAVLFVSMILINEKFIAIDFARKEIVGNEYIGALRAATLGTLAGGRPSGSADAVLGAEERHGMARGNLGSRQLAHALAAHLRPLEAGDARSAGQEHAVASAVQALITRIGNQSNLILDPDLDSYYTMSLVVLRFPELFDLIGRIRDQAQSAAAAAPNLRVREQSSYLILEGRLDAVVGGIDSDYAEAVAAGTPQLGATLQPARHKLLAALDAFRASARQLAIGQGGVRHETDPDGLALAAWRQLDAAWASAGTALNGLLQERIDGLFQRMWLHLGTAAALLLLLLSVVYFVARQIALPLRRLAEVADGVRRSGDYTLRATWRSGDEIGRLINAFNDMLDQLDRSRRVERELAAQASAAEAQRQLLDAVPIPLLVTATPRHEVLHTNAQANAWLDGRRSDPWANGLLAEARVSFFQMLADSGAVDEFEVLWHGATRREWALISARRLRYQDRDAVLTAFTPIGRIKQMEERLELWARVFEASSESILITDATRTILTANRAFCRSTAYECLEVVDDTPTFLRSDRHPDGFYEEVWQVASVRGHWQGEMWIRRKTGEALPVWAALNAVRDEAGRITHYIATWFDISERKADEQRISHLAQHDVLTDLPNRALCVERLRLALQQADRHKRRVAVLFIDLDRFKNINDSLGHHIGDGVLRSVSSQLQRGVRSGDTVSRMGGDEFVVILNGVTDVEEIRQIVECRLIRLIRQPHNVGGAELHVSCSIGIAVYPEDGVEIETLMRNADAAMYQAKQQGRNNAQFFTLEMDRRARERMQIENDLRVGIERQQLRVFYQPRVDCRSGKLLGAEALVRWHHPEQGLITPGRFIPVAEDSGLIIPLGAWVLSEACRQQKRWRTTGQDLAISVNLSAGQLHDPDLLATLQRAITEHGVNPAMIELELTESLLMEDVTLTIDLLLAIKALGISLSVDDFGTGYSSLNYLHRFPIDKLKIDQSFVTDMLDDPNDLAITKAVIGLGHTLGLRVVAEGVEQAEEMRVLAAAGCDELQGYLFGKPMPADEFALWRKAFADGNERWCLDHDSR
ncbi:MAG: putative signaling protein [Accumulibacter sp.]|uniref:EAL domain-containing protein n=1 Tax=Accumulibacter sp. TaxID=2053492 RepID=UPI00122B8AE9|nr:EAL domain-containing protein [Accumulibacter sp.]TLD44500.1 MAG: putative signaling protein [Accumulibacter sp.]